MSRYDYEDDPGEPEPIDHAARAAWLRSEYPAVVAGTSRIYAQRQAPELLKAAAWHDRRAAAQEAIR